MMPNKEKSYDLLLLENAECTTFLAYCPAYEGIVGGVAEMDGRLCKIIDLYHGVAGDGIIMIGADAVDAIYAQTWKSEEEEHETD